MTIPATGKPEDRARANIDRLLTASGWLIENRSSINIEAARGVAIREFPLAPGQGLFKILNDLVSTLARPLEWTVNCARAIEGIGHLISPSKPKPEQWEALRTNLNLSKDYLTLITNESKAPRHGQLLPVKNITLSEIRKRSWTVMDRFLTFRKIGNVPLPISDFPVL